MMTAQELAKCTGARLDRAEVALPHVVSAMTEFDIDTDARQAMFLAQIGHESAGLHYTTELWGPTEAQSRYEGRADLGNDAPGDGFKYRGRGYIQITGKANYKIVSQFFTTDFVLNPDLLAEPEFAARSAAWFWKWHALNEMADAGDFYAITRRINGGLNGVANRLELLAGARQALQENMA